MEWALVENVQRADLNPIEEATAFQTLMTEFGLTQAEVAERVGKSRPAITNTVRLLSLPMEVQQAVIDGQITAGHARALLGLSDPEAILHALSEVIRRELSVRQTEAFVRRMNETLAKPASSATEEDTNLQSHLRYLEDRFRSALGTKVTLHRNPDGGGRLIVHFYSDEDLESLFRLITGGEDG
jgi:ParB family chromosome partitioning protein